MVKKNHLAWQACLFFLMTTLFTNFEQKCQSQDTSQTTTVIDDKIKNAVVADFLEAVTKQESDYKDGSAFKLESPGGKFESCVVYVFPEELGVVREVLRTVDGVPVDFVVVETPASTFSVMRTSGSSDWILKELKQTDTENQFSVHFEEIRAIKTPWALGGVSFVNILTRDYVELLQASLNSSESIGTIRLRCHRQSNSTESIVDKIPFLVDSQDVSVRFDVQNGNRILDIAVTGMIDGVTYSGTESISYKANDVYSYKQTVDDEIVTEYTIEKIRNVDFSSIKSMLTPEHYGINARLPDTEDSPILSWWMLLVIGAICIAIGRYYHHGNGKR
jgi:hypothetical protein